MRNYFGTDGVRGEANSSLTPELAFKLGLSAGSVLSDNAHHPTFVVGRDTRLSGEMLEASLVSGLMAAGIEVIQLGVIPTPGVAYMTRKLVADGGVMISASHNPYQDNGIKFFDKNGNKLSDDMEHKIEALIEAPENIKRALRGDIGYVSHYPESINQYASFLKETIDNDLSGMRIVLDCANGAASPIAHQLFSDLNAEVLTIYNDPNGQNINVDCGSTNPNSLSQVVLSKKADLGLAFDGDADRLIAVDHEGNIIDGDAILYICGKALKERGTLKHNTVVSTIMSNFGFKKALQEAGISNPQTGVGDRYVLEEMMAHDYSLGGEQSGHIIFADYNTTGDGLLSGIQLASYINKTTKSLSELASEMEKFPQFLENVYVKDKNAWETNPLVQNHISDAVKELNGNGRVLIRASGTEELVRVMVEGKNEGIAKLLTNTLSQAIKNI